MNREERVAEFAEAAGFTQEVDEGPLESHVACFGEEVQEFLDAMKEYLEDRREGTRQQLVKEWADVQVTLSQLAWYFHIDGDEAFRRVADNNMTKLVDGKILRRADGKIMKPDDYVRPDMAGL